LLKRIWILGGISCRIKDFFIEEVDKRDATTLREVILRHAKSDITIVTDCLKG